MVGIEGMFPLMESEGVWDSIFMKLEGETMKRIYGSNGINKTSAVSTEMARTGLRGDGGNKMKETLAAQAWIGIRRRQQRDNNDCGSNSGGKNLSWIGLAAATRRLYGNKSSDETALIEASAAAHNGLSGNGSCSGSGRRRELGVTIAALLYGGGVKKIYMEAVTAEAQTWIG